MGKEKELIIKQHAHEELQNSYDFYVEEYSTEYAEKFRKAFYKQVQRLLPNYNGFPECRYLVTKTRKYRNIIWGNYWIIYKITSSTVEVLSLFHTRRNPKQVKRLKRIR